MGGCKRKQTASGQANAKKKKDMQDALYQKGKELVLHSVDKTPVPSTVLSVSQAIKAQPRCLELKFRSVYYDKHAKCWLPKWDVVRRGPEFIPNKEGFIVCRASCITTLKKQNRTHTRLRFTGEPNPEPDRLVLLVRWIREGPNMGKRKQLLLDDTLLKGVPAVKPPLFKKKAGKHHGSSGNYYAYGKTATCGKKDHNLSSVHPFAMRPHTEADEEQMKNLDHQHTLVMAKEIQRAQDVINGGALAWTTGTAVTKSGTLFSKAVQVFGTKANASLEDNLGMIPGTNYPAAFLCHNAATAVEHTEADCSYTIIRSPNQPGMKYNDQPRGAFHFNLGSETIVVPLLMGMNIYYNGFLIPHNQKLYKPITSFYNVSAYGNMKCISHGRNTIKRNKEAIKELAEDNGKLNAI